MRPICRPRHSTNAAFVAVTALATFALPGSPFAPKAASADARTDAPETRAAAHFDRGVSLYGEGDFRAALAEFRRAYELSPNPAVLYNVGQAALELGEYAAALDALERYDADTAKMSPARRKQVTQQMETLRARVGTLAIRVDTEGAEVFVDDTAIGRAPIEGLIRVSAGRRRVTVARPGMPPLTKAVEIAGGETREVSFELGSTAGEARAAGVEADLAASPPTPHAHEESRSKTPLFAAWGATGALAVGTVVLGAMTLSAQADLAAERDRAGATRASLDEAQSRVRTFALATDIVGLSAVAAAGVSIWLTLRTRPRGSATQTLDRRETHARIGSRIADERELRVFVSRIESGTGVGVAGSF